MEGSWVLLFKVRFIMGSPRPFVESYAFLFAGCTKEAYYNVRTSIKTNHMGVCNEDNKSRELCMREGGLYVGPWTTLGSSRAE